MDEIQRKNEREEIKKERLVFYSTLRYKGSTARNSAYEI